MTSDSKPFNLVILASGGGTNAENLIRHFQHTELAKVTSVITNNKAAGVISRATKLGVLVRVISNAMSKNGNLLLPFLLKEKPDLIILAGYLRKIPAEVVHAFPNRIINIHPALLPNYGGKGMYGMKVHEAVYANKDPQTGITIHYVNEAYDEGQVILQKSVELTAADSPDSIAAKVHELEMQWFPIALEDILDSI
jgi:phosphoribosylglycinamide formyltransferase 1